jgi:hypothetical protein
LKLVRASPLSSSAVSGPRRGSCAIPNLEDADGVVSAFVAAGGSVVAEACIGAALRH